MIIGISMRHRAMHTIVVVDLDVISTLDLDDILHDLKCMPSPLVPILIWIIWIGLIYIEVFRISSKYG